VPFDFPVGYFLCNERTGFSGVAKRFNAEPVVFATSSAAFTCEESSIFERESRQSQSDQRLKLSLCDIASR